MRMCGRCGAANTDDADFCGNCGGFLEFDEAPQSPAGPVATVPTTQVGGVPVGGVPVGGVAGAGTVSPATVPTGTVPTGTVPTGTAQSGAVQSGAGTAVPTAPAGPTGPAAGPAAGPAGTATAPPVGQSTGTPPVGQPTATPPVGQPAQPGVPAVVQPGVAETRRHRTVEVVTERLKPGDILCANCNAGNPSDRRFCRRCGQPLVTAPLKLSWWRRLLKRLRGEPLTAGYRPRRRRRLRFLTPLAVILLLGIVGVAVVPALRAPARRAYDAARGAVLDRFSQPTQVVPKAAAASSSAPGGEAAKLIDGANNTFWSPKIAPPAIGEWCQIQLERPVYVAKLLITPGIDTKEDTFRTQARPAKIQIITRRADGSETKQTKTLDDRPKAQEINVRASKVTQITIVIQDAYGSQPGRLVAVAEVEVFVRR